MSAPSRAAVGAEAGAHFAAQQNRIYNRAMGEVVLVTVHGGEPGAVVEAGRRLLSRVGASSGSVHVRVGADDRAVVAALDTEHEADGMITLRGTGGDVISQLDLPPGAQLVGAYRAEELVRLDYDRSWGVGEPSPGVSLICLVRRRPDLSWQAYSDHWRDNHGPLALRRQPGFWRYVQNHVVERLTDETPDFDGIGELHFRTARAVLEEMFDSPEGVAEIMADTERFMAHEGSTTLPSTEWLL
jgi:uncharacterized protein (TIGR02118 family)